jgi:tetratricopeptide (TPR) repeat protein
MAEAQGVAIARRLGARRLVLGGVVGTPGNLVVTATLRDVATGQSTSAEVRGSPDSVLVLVDRLAAQLLALDARVDRMRLADATSRSLPALKEYLVGQSFYRRGSFEQARNHYRKALELDSTFALAALGNAASGAYGQPTEAARRAAGVELAWRLRAKLSTRDQALFDAYVPARYPRERSAALDLATWQKATAAAPELPELWYGFADRLFHTGAWLGIDRPWQRAKPSFERALEMDSTFVPPLSHLVEIAISEGDTTALRRLAALYFARDSAADEADGIRWRVSVALRDRRLHERVDAEMPTFAVSTLARIMALGQIENIAYEDIERAAATMRTVQTTTASQLAARLALHNLALNSGQPREALAALAPLRTPGGSPHVSGSFYNLAQLVVLDALYGAGDTTAAAEEVKALEARIGEPNVEAHEPRAEQYADACTAELWRVRHGDFSTVDRTLARLRAGASPRDSVGFHGGNPDLCAAVLEGELALVRDTSSARARAVRLDSMMRQGPTRYGADFGNIVAARLFERAGDVARARAALVRRPYYAYPGTIFLAEVLLHRARLSTRLGDRADALASYRHYVALRGRAPEPALKPEVDRVRRELAALARPQVD